MDAITPLTASVTVDSVPDDAFRAFTEDFGAWWPAEFTWSQSALLHSIVMDCRIGGLLTEIGPHGFRVDWGRMITWDPPSSLEFLWQISAERVPVPDPDQSSIVAVAFTPTGSQTTVEVTHRGWEHHGAGAREYRDQFQPAWPLALDRFRSHVAG